MRRDSIVLLLLCWLLASAGSLARAQENTSAVNIQSPLPGQALQGSVPILGTIAVDAFSSAEVSFGYTSDTSGTWFLIQQVSEPLSDAQLTTWDTTIITDGNYNLRMVVTLTDGSQITVFVLGVRVRNYTPIETDTPTPITPTATPAPGELPSATSTLTPTLTPFPPSPTPLPTNPAIITLADIQTSVGTGTLITFGLFLCLSIYLALHWLRRR
jgi:hypothetical protein